MNDKIKVKNIVLRCGADSLLPLMLVYMLYIIFHGHLSPGGGFQGGVLMVAVVTILYLGHGYETTTRTLSANLLHGTEGFASVMYVALAMLGVSIGAQFWLTVFLFLYLWYRKKNRLLLPVGIMLLYMAGNAFVPIVLLRYFAGIFLCHPMIAAFLLQPGRSGEKTMTEDKP